MKNTEIQDLPNEYKELVTQIIPYQYRSQSEIKLINNKQCFARLIDVESNSYIIYQMIDDGKKILSNPIYQHLTFNFKQLLKNKYYDNDKQ